ncbi:kinase-like domain-containing protein [Cubamyces menziesii]|nr:kinase-like domain-containing protein [Cubamyces menziesii]
MSVRDLPETSEIGDGFGLASYEVYWRELCPFLESRGYVLRPRYQPGWKRSWEALNIPFFKAEDHISLPLHGSRMIDATRVVDGQLVYLKKVLSSSHELEICRFFSSESLRRDPRNHCVPLVEVLPHPTDPETSFIVMPFLRNIDDPAFETIEDILECGEQLLEGLSFMHEHDVAHRDCAYPNVMMDASAMYPRGFHPVYTWYLPDASGYADVLPRSSVRVTYYLIDFGISTHSTSKDTPRLVLGTDGIDGSVPELSNDVPYDPFKTDIYVLGALFRQVFLEKYSNVDIIAPLVASMTATDPQSRPDASTALTAWRSIRDGLSTGQKSWRAKSRNESLLGSMLRDAKNLLTSAVQF